MTIRIAAIGVSHWHSLYDAAYLHHFVAMPDVEIVALHDDDPALVAKRAAEVGNPPTYTDHKQMLAAVRPDFVMALGRHSQMAGYAHDLIDLGFPFLMEKPMGLNAAEVESVAEKAAKRGAFAAVALPQRYGAFARYARKFMADGTLGTLSHIYVRTNRPTPPRYPAWDCAWMLDPAEAGGGSLRNLGAHGLDLFLYLTGEDTVVTGAQTSRRAHQVPVEDYASVLLRSKSGILGTVEVGNCYPRVGYDAELKIAGREAILTFKDGVLKLATAKGDEILPGADEKTPYAPAIRDTLDCWQQGKPAPVDVNDCLRMVRLIDQGYRLAG